MRWPFLTVDADPTGNNSFRFYEEEHHWENYADGAKV
jgi:hypothetical protein